MFLRGVFASVSEGPRTFSAKEVVVRTALNALNSLNISGQSAVILYLDALEVVNIDPIINNIQVRGRCFESFEVIYIPKKLNKVAHGLAKWGQ